MGAAGDNSSAAPQIDRFLGTLSFQGLSHYISMPSPQAAWDGTASMFTLIVGAARSHETALLGFLTYLPFLLARVWSHPQNPSSHHHHPSS